MLFAKIKDVRLSWHRQSPCSGGVWVGREAASWFYPVCSCGTNSTYSKFEKIPLFGLPQASHVEKGRVGMGACVAVNTACSLLLASPRLTGAMAREGKVAHLRNGNCLASTAMEERLCTSPGGEGPRGSGSPVQKLFSSLPSPQRFSLLRHSLAQTRLFSYCFHLPLF